MTSNKIASGKAGAVQGAFGALFVWQIRPSSRNPVKALIPMGVPYRQAS